MRREEVKILMTLELKTYYEIQEVVKLKGNFYLVLHSNYMENYTRRFSLVTIICDVFYDIPTCPCKGGWGKVIINILVYIMIF